MSAARDDFTDFGSFSQVDATPDSAPFVEALDNIAAVPAVQRLRSTANELLAVRLGHRVVDVGCGTGDQVRVLAAAVGATGSVIGIDPSETLLAEARRRTGWRAARIEYRLGDATQLDLEDASVDGARCERVFQHLADPVAAMAELVRVTRPGGRIVVVDTDWGMHAIHGADPEITDRVLAGWNDYLSTPLAGRQLPGLFADAGLREPTVASETFTILDPARASQSPFPEMATAASVGGLITADEADTWLAQLRDAARRGRFLWAATMFAVGATRPR
jgi:SAM-dependent methyltransferase